MIRLMPDLLSENGMKRCWWCGDDPLYVAYHDREWGVPVRDNMRLFEKIVLEGFQAGLSWLTILRKRENFRRAFHDFRIERVAKLTEGDVGSMLVNVGIVRHRGKIESAINNAQRAMALIEERGSLIKYFEEMTASCATLRRPRSREEIAAMTPASKAISRDLKRRGWTFVGPTTMHAMMQAVGLVNDHIVGCSAGDRIEAAAASTTAHHD